MRRWWPRSRPVWPDLVELPEPDMIVGTTVFLKATPVAGIIWLPEVYADPEHRVLMLRLAPRSSMETALRAAGRAAIAHCEQLVGRPITDAQLGPIRVNP